MGKTVIQLRALLFFIVIVVFTAVVVGFIYQGYFEQNSISQRYYPSQTQSVFEPVLPNAPVKLPDDFRFHNQYQHERWHYFANLEDQNGEHYSVQWTYTRVATDDREGGGWQNPHLYISYVVVSSDKQVWKEQRLARGGIGQAGLTHQPFRLWIDNWQLYSSGRTPFPGVLSLASDSFNIQLKIKAEAPCVLPGEKGYVEKYPLLSVASYNFACPFLKVEGDLKLDKNELKIVQGQGWMSKEWGTGLFRGINNNLDWFTFHLDSETVLSVSRYRQSQTTAYWRGELFRSSGQVTNLLPKDILIQPTEFSYLTNGKRIPVAWKIEVKKLDISLTAHMSNTELWLPFVIPYWQGSIRASGSHNASGFMLLMGY
ncbi:lipocalin-like domain-containing protein [Vibrio pectenicida]|uniref:Carotenoid 1,2-hydratase n=1 Tax=Vibrio pectenicida TaxID=62763 RepID=A0A3R9EE11_9VIBR|nr:lipocalin-like domain-containing protein [Vibrio pectenicida]RSD29645.1 carotenoid 1,2-hydratase [Vibrio pectenicida]